MFLKPDARHLFQALGGLLHLGRAQVCGAGLQGVRDQMDRFQIRDLQAGAIEKAEATFQGGGSSEAGSDVADGDAGGEGSS